MFKKGTKLYSITKGKCPRCQEAGFFKYPFSFNPTKVTKIDNNCANCNLKYMLEPSFFFGAMYVNYGLSVGISIVAFLISKLIFDFSLLQCFGVILIALFVLAPVNLRLARILWINLFVNYDPTNKNSKN
jgi:uncharacterized protein (DUF983 family)